MRDVSLDAEKLNQISFSMRSRSHMRDYMLLMKPRVMSLVIFTGFVGLIMAPGSIDTFTAIVAVLCIAFGAGAAGAINMWYDRDIDAHMARTVNRPLPAGRLRPVEALILGVVFSIVSVITMTLFVNPMAGTLLAATIAYYIFIYTIWLKRRTPQNIVIGGASGAFPPMIGWAAVTGGVDWGSVILFLIIFMWTPPHFWSLALFRFNDYKRAGVPMMPVVAGKRETRKLILIYTLALVPVTLAPVIIGISSMIYGAAALLLGVMFTAHAVKVWCDKSVDSARPMFLFSILYLFLIFMALIIDKAIAPHI